MTRFSYLLVFALAIMLTATLNVKAQEEQQTELTGDIVLKAIPQNKDAIFNDGDEVKYKLQIRNNTNQLQSGKISYLVTTDEGKHVALSSVDLNLKGKADKEMLIKVPAKATGFYRINFMVNTPDYDDTVRRVFG